MKVYVIKNKKGKYFDDFQDFETNNICDARLFETYEEALSFCPKNCNCDVVKFTLAEGDLEQEIQELKTRVAELQDKDWYEKCIKQLEEQNDKLIKERDEIQKEYNNYFESFGCKDFAEFQELIGLTKISANDKARDAIIRKQVCDEIRTAVNCLTSFECDFGCDVVFKKRFDEYLDKIEKGENDEND